MVLDDKKYGKDYKSHYLEQYKLYLASAEKISDRRDAANRYFLAINSALFLVIGLALRYAIDNISVLLISVTALGLLISFIFWRLLTSYKQLNTVKFELIHKIERNLPLQLYKNEWEHLGEGRDRKKYWPFSHVERWVPITFGLFYAVILVVSLTQLHNILIS